MFPWGLRCIMGTFGSPENDLHNFLVNTFSRIYFSRPEQKKKSNLVIWTIYHTLFSPLSMVFLPALDQRDIPSVSFYKPLMNLIKSITSYPSKLYFHTSFILLSESIFYYWMTLEAFYLLIPTITLKGGKLYHKQGWRPWIELVLIRYQKAAHS